MKPHVNVIYDKKTKRVILYEVDHEWVIPASWNLAHFEGDVEPVLEEKDGNLYFKPNAMIISNL